MCGENAGCVCVISVLCQVSQNAYSDCRMERMHVLPLHALLTHAQEG